MICTSLMEEVPTHLAFLLTRARRLCRNEADARDLVQDTCLHALEALKRSDTPPDNLQVERERSETESPGLQVDVWAGLVRWAQALIAAVTVLEELVSADCRVTAVQ